MADNSHIEKSVVITDNVSGKSVTLPVTSGTIGPDVIDIRKLYGETGMFTYDPGYGATGSCTSGLTYIDGDKGILRYRGYDIEDLAKNHRLICYSPSSTQITAGQKWIAPFLDKQSFSLLFLNNYYGIFRAVRNGLGIGTLPDYLASDFPELVQVLPEFQSDMVPVHIAYPQELKKSKQNLI